MPLRLSRPQDWLAIRAPVVMLAGAVALLFLVACTNVAHLLLARGAARQRELAVRHALGAGRSRLVRQLLTESLVLAAFGGALAVAVGWAALRLLIAERPPTMVALTYVSERGMVPIAAVLTIGCSMAIGMLAALRTARRDVGVAIRAAAWSTPRTGQRLRASLVIGEVALSTTLLVGALLLIHSVVSLERRTVGFDPRGLYSVDRDEGGVEATLHERGASIGVLGITDGNVPVGAGVRGFEMLTTFDTPERPAAPTDTPRGVGMADVASNFFEVTRTPFLAGHTFDDGSKARNEVIVSASLARQIWPDGIAVGQRFRPSNSPGPSSSGPAMPGAQSSPTPWRTVIGVVPDARFNRIDDEDAKMYEAGEGAALIVRLDPRMPDAVARLTALARSGVSDSLAATRVAVTDVEGEIEKSLAEPRFLTSILVALALLGMVLAAVGLFGVISYAVGQRTREIGVRMTLGATRGSIARLVVGDGMRLAIVGIAIGLVGAAMATRVIERALYGLPRLDPLAFAGGASLLLVVSAVACLVPTVRAAAIDPALAVRAE
jgi:predicted permease